MCPKKNISDIGIHHVQTCILFCLAVVSALRVGVAMVILLELLYMSTYMMHYA